MDAAFHLDGNHPEAIERYLRKQQWIAPAEVLVSAKKPGEGNMNYTLRVRTTFRTFILKQSRPYVEKYPSIPAPPERAVTEGRFYELIQVIPELREFTPEVSFMDESNAVLMLEDLGESSDFTSLYQPDKVLKPEEISALMSFLSQLHNRISPADASYDFSNMGMRRLNAEHIFTYPFLEEIGFDLDTVTPGLQEVAMTYKTDTKLKSAVSDLSESYLGEGNHLLHGDYYPGSWLNTLRGVKVIDPEFCFFGRAEFDLSVMLAHTWLAEQPDEVRAGILSEYEYPAGFDRDLMHRLCGVEIMRRLIGLAQLPLSMDLSRKEALLAEAARMVTS